MRFPPLPHDKSFSPLVAVLRLVLTGLFGVAIGVLLLLVFWPLLLVLAALVLGFLLWVTYMSWRLRRALRKAGEQFAAAAGRWQEAPGGARAPDSQEPPVAEAPGPARHRGAKRVEVKITHIESPPPGGA